MVRKTQHFHDRMFAAILMLMIGLDVVFAAKNNSLPLGIAAVLFAAIFGVHIAHMARKYGPHKHLPGRVREEIVSAKYGNTFTDVQCYHNGPAEPF